MNTHTPFAFEDYAAVSRNYLGTTGGCRRAAVFQRVLDGLRLAAHDWPDFGDVTSRQLQGPSCCAG
jgi:hypothetical protein